MRNSENNYRGQAHSSVEKSLPIMGDILAWIPSTRGRVRGGSKKISDINLLFIPNFNVEFKLILTETTLLGSDKYQSLSVNNLLTI